MLEVHKLTYDNQNGATRHLCQENPRPAACIDGNWQTRAISLNQIARLPTTHAIVTTCPGLRRIGGASPLGGQQAVLAHHELGVVGIDGAQNTRFGRQFGNTLRIIAEQLGRQVHPTRAEPT